MQVWELLRAAATIVDEGWASGCDAQDLEGRPIPLFYGEGRATINVWHGGKWHGGRFGARSRSPSAPAGISVGPLITVDRGDTTFAARSGFRFRVALVISAGGNFGRPLITVDRGDTSEVSGGGVLGGLQRP